MRIKHKRLLQGLQLSLTLTVLLGISSCFSLTSPELLNKKQKALELVDQGTIALREIRLERAKGAFLAALEVSANAAAFDGLGCVAFLSGDLDQAESFFLQAYKQDPNYVNVLGNLALLYESRGEAELAYEMYQKILTQQPENFRARNNFAAYLSDYNLEDSAKSELFKALALAKHPTVQENLERMKAYE